MSASSEVVEKDIVQLEFQNDQFEAGVHQSMDTLQQLKESLNFEESVKGFDDLNKATSKLDLSSVAKNVEFLAHRFSFLGEFVHGSVKKMVSGIEHLGKTIVNYALKPFNQIKTGGWSRALNIENSMFKMSGILDDFEAQQVRINENIDHAVNGTAYSYDAAASAMAQLVASGVEFREGSDDMMKALRGISGVAAQTGSDYSDIANIFTKVAGNGRLMGDDLQRLSARGLNAAATLGKHLGKTEEEIRKMTSKGKIDFQTFADAMDDAFGKHAKKANDTFDGAFRNIKAALSRTGQGFAQSIQHYGRDILNAIRPNINKFNKEYLQPLVDDFDAVMAHIAKAFGEIFGTGQDGLLDFSWVPPAIATLENIFLTLVGIGKEAKKIFEELFAPADRLISPLMHFFVTTRSFTAKMRDAVTDLKAITKPAVDIFKEAKNKTEEVVKTAEALDELAHRVISGEFGNGQKRFKALEDLGYNYKFVQNRVNELLDCSYRYDLTAEELAEAQAKFGIAAADSGEAVQELTEEEVRHSKLLDGIRNTLLGVKAAMQIIKNVGTALMNVFIKPFISWSLPRILTAIFDFLGKIGEELQYFANYTDDLQKLNGFSNTIKLVAGIAASSIRSMFGQISRLHEWLASLPSVQGIGKSIIDFFKSIPGFIKTAGEEFGKFVEKFKTSEGFTKFLEAVTGIKDQVKKIATEKLEKLNEFITNLKENGPKLPDLPKFFEDLGKRASEAAEAVAEFIKNFKMPEWVNKLFDRVVKFFVELPENVGKVIEKIKEFWEQFKETPQFKSFVESFDKLKESISELGEKGLNFINEKLTNISGLKFPSLEDFVSGLSSVVGFLTTGIDKVTEFIDLIKGSKEVNNVIETVQSAIDLNGSAFSSGRSVAKGSLADLFKNGFSWFTKDAASQEGKDVAEGFGEQVSKFVDQIPFDKLGGVGKVAVLTWLGIQIGKFFKNISDGAKSVTDIPGKFVGILGAAKGVLVAWQDQINAKKILYIAAAVGIFTASLIALTKFTDMDKLIQVVADIAVLMLVLGRVFKMYSLIPVRNKVVEKAAEQVVESATNVEKSATTWKDVLSGAGKTIGESIITFGKTIAAALRGFGIAAMLIAFSVSILILLHAIKTIEEMTATDKATREFGKAAGILAGIAASLAVLSVIIAKFGQVNAGTGLGLLLIANALVVLVGAIAILTQVLKLDNIGLALLVLELLVLELVSLGMAFDKIDGGSILKFSVAAFVLTAALYALIPALYALSFMKLKQVGTSLFMLGASMAILLAVAKNADVNMAGVGAMVAIGAAMLILASSLVILGDMNLEFMGGALLTLGVAMVAFIGALVVISALMNEGIAAKFLTLTASLLAIGVTALLISASLLLLGIALPYVTDGLAYLGEGLQKNADAIGLGFLAVVAAILGAIIAAKFLIGKSITEVGTQVIGAFGKLVGPIISFLGTALGKIVKALIVFIIVAAGPLGEGIAKAMIAVADSLMKNRYIIMEAIFKLIYAIFSAAVTALGFIGNIIAGTIDDIFGTNFQEKVDGAFEKWNSDLDEGYSKLSFTAEEGGKKVGAAAADGVTEGITEGLSTNSARNEHAALMVADQVTTKYSEELDFATPTADEMNAAGEEVEKGGWNIKQYVGENMAGATDEARSNFDLTGVISDEMQNADGTWDLSPLLGSVPDFGQNLSTMFGDNFDLTHATGDQLGQITSMLNGEDGEYDITGAFQNMVDSGPENANFDSWEAAVDTGYDRYDTRLAERAESSPGAQAMVDSAVTTINDADIDYARGAEGNINAYNGTLASEASKEKVSASAREVVNSGVNALNEGPEKAKTAGAAFVGGATSGWIGGITGALGDAKKAAGELLTSTASGLKDEKDTIKTEGKMQGANYVTGVSSNKEAAKTAGTDLRDSAVVGAEGTGKKTGYKQMYQVGSDAGEGYYDGLDSWLDDIVRKARQIVEDAIAEAKAAQDSASPSKKFRQLGKWAGEGYAIGIESLTGKVIANAAGLADGGYDAMQGVVGKIYDVMDSNIDYEPTIRPVMDLTDIENGAGLINDTFAGMDTYIPVSAIKGTGKITMGGRFATDEVNLTGAQMPGTVNNFTQNNYSPKALSRLEIYRQTRNMFALAKGQANA